MFFKRFLSNLKCIFCNFNCIKIIIFINWFLHYSKVFFIFLFLKLKNYFFLLDIYFFLNWFSFGHFLFATHLVIDYLLKKKMTAA